MKFDFDPFESIKKSLEEISLHNAQAMKNAIQSIQKSNSDALKEAMRRAAGSQLIAISSTNDALEKFRIELSRSFQEISASLQAIQHMKIQVPSIVIPKLELLIDRTAALVPESGSSQVAGNLTVTRPEEVKKSNITWKKVYEVLMGAALIYSNVVHPIQTSIQSERHHQERMEIDKERLKVEQEQLSVYKELLEVDKQNLLLNQESKSKRDSFEQAFNSCVSSIGSLIRESDDSN
ncbi:hypothetical protein ACF3MZ_21410 [Paenibacillaceae bacterium WGS1546]|uniref:hypothetical protein n=1 Tax=Cohnella sp. WGS1546 TaxID=3366810 RepID=UPI00372D68F9